MLVGVVSEVVYHVSGVLVGGLFALLFYLGRMSPRLTTQAWSTGARGEVRTASLLDPLAQAGYVVMHDLRISMSRANIDHLVIGPTGVFVVETKNVRGPVRIDGRDVRMGGRRVGVVDELAREVSEVRGVLGELLDEYEIAVSALVCVHRAELPWFRHTVAGIRFVYPGRLTREIAKQPAVLDAIQVAKLRNLAERYLPPRST